VPFLPDATAFLEPLDFFVFYWLRSFALPFKILTVIYYRYV